MPLRFALLGDPVEHSRSPAIVRAALRQAGLEGDYLAITADRSRLEQATDELRSGDFDGLNVTMPLKRDAADVAEELTPEGARAGSVNTMRVREGIVEGHSTDTVALCQIFEELQGVENVLVLGSGGAASAALAALQGHNVHLSARSPEKAAALAGVYRLAGVIPWGTSLDGAVVINTTPLGMKGETLPAGVIEAASAIIDLPYGASPTPAIEMARRRALPAVDGLEFLCRQAAASFQWWTGVPVDFESLASAARNV